MGKLYKLLWFWELCMKNAKKWMVFIVAAMALGGLLGGCSSSSQADRLMKKVKKHPENISLRIDLAYALDLEKRYDEAIKQYDTLSGMLDKNPDKYKKYYYIIKNNNAKTLHSVGRFKDALAIFEELRKVPGKAKDSQLAYNIGACYHGMKNYAKAQGWYATAMKLNSKNTEAQGAVALLQQDMEQARRDEARKAGERADKLKKEIKKKPNVVSLRMELAAASDYLGDWETSLEQYEKVLELKGDAAPKDALPNKIRALYYLGHYREALDLLVEIDKKTPDDSETNMRIGKCHQGLENYEEAVKYLEKSVKLDKKNAAAADALKEVQGLMKKK